MNVSVTRIGAPLQYIPVRHACGHFELRYTRWNGFDPRTTQDPPNADGFLKAGSPCTQCAPQGRPVDQNYPTLEAAQAAATDKNAADPRQRPGAI